MKNPFQSLWNKLRRFFLFRRLVLSFFALSLICVLFICGVLFMIFENSTKRELEYMATPKLDRTNSAVTQTVSSLIPIMNHVLSLSYTETFFYGSQLNRINEQNVLIRLRQLQNSYDQIYNISIINFNNERFLGTQGVATGYVPEILSGEEPELGTAFGMPYYKRETPRNINIDHTAAEAVITFIYTPKGLYSHGAVIIDVKMSYLEQVLHVNTEDDWGKVLFVNRAGQVIAGDGEAVTAEELQELLGREPGSYVEQLGGQKSFISFAESDIPDCFVVLAMPYKRLMPFADSLRQGLTFAVLLFIVIIVLLSGILVNRIYNPLGDLVKHSALFTEKEPLETQRSIDELKLLYTTMMDYAGKLNMLENYRDESVSMLGRSWLGSLLRGDIDFAEKATRLTHVDPADFENRYFCVAVVAVDGFSGYCEENDEEARRLNDFAMSNVLDELMRGYVIESLVRMDDNILAAGLSFQSAVMPEEIVLALREFQASMLKFFSLSLSVGIGLIKSEWKEIPQSFKEAKEALSHRFYAGPSAFLSAGEIEGHAEAVYPGKAEKKLCDAMLLRSADQVKRAAGSFLHAVNRFDATHIKIYVERCIYSVGMLAQENQPAVKKRRRALKEALVKAENLVTVQSLMEQYCVDQLMYMEAPGTNAGKEDDPVKVARDYIEEHYDDINLSVEFLAGLVGLSPSYFGKQFSAAAGMSCLDYISDVRMSRAAQMLLATDLPASDISRKTGINSINYFYILFKKKYGLTPKQYRSTYKNQRR